MQRILISLSAFSDKGNDEELTKVDLRPLAPVPNIDNDPVAHLRELNEHVSNAVLEIGKLPDLHTRYQLRRLVKMAVRYENSTMPDENI